MSIHTNPAVHNRTLFLEDNLPVLRGMDSDSVDLIATDPAFQQGCRAHSRVRQATTTTSSSKTFGAGTTTYNPAG